MSIETEIAAVERQVRELERLPAVRQRTDHAIARADRVLDRTRNRKAYSRDLEAIGKDIGSRLLWVGIAIGVVSIATIGIGMVAPIGLFGFIAAVGLAIALAAVALFWPAQEVEMPAETQKLGNADMVKKFDRYIHQERKALPPPAQQEVDRILTRLPELGKVMARVDAGDPQAADARRLMSRHLPGLIDRYEQVPKGYRDSRDNEGLSVDERLTDGLKAGRKALEELGEKLAKRDVSALETHGRFIKDRYGEKEPPLG